MREFELVRFVMKTPDMTTNTRLDTIATRQRSTRVRDAIFAAFVALAAVIAVTTVSTAADAATPAHVASR